MKVIRRLIKFGRSVYLCVTAARTRRPMEVHTMRAPTPTQTESFSQADHSTGLDLSDGTEDVLPRDPHLREHEPNKHLILSLQETVKRLLTEQHALHTKITNMQETMDFQNATIHLLEAELSAARRPSTTLDSAVDRANNALSKPSSSVKIASSTSSPGTGHTGQRRRSRQSVDSYSQHGRPTRSTSPRRPPRAGQRMMVRCWR